MRNAAGGPWAFWIEMKGYSTPIKRTPKQKEANRAGDQAAWAYEQMAAGVPVFLLRGSWHMPELFDAIGFPHKLERSVAKDSATGEPLELEFCAGQWRRQPEKEKEVDAQREAKRTLKWHGFHVTDTSQGYRPGGKGHGSTRITLGTPDLYVTRPALEGADFIFETGFWLPPADRNTLGPGE